MPTWQKWDNFMGCHIKPQDNQVILFLKSQSTLIITWPCCLTTLCHNLTAAEVPINAQWFMQDGGRPHIANVVLDFLNETSGPKVISHFPGCCDCGQVWPPHSSVTNLCDFFLWGFMKVKLYSRKLGSLMEFRAMIIHLCNTISEELCHKVITNVQVHL
jgi:hypothetical protein